MAPSKKDAANAGKYVGICANTFSLEKLQTELAALSSDEDRIKELTKRLAASEKERLLLVESANNSDKLKKAVALLEKKSERANALVLKTEESKGRLEELCRELQKVNKELREESANRLKMMETERSAAVEKLRQSLNDIQTSMQEGHGKSDQLAEENRRLAGKMAELATEYQERMQKYSEQNDHKEKCWRDLQNAHQAEAKLLKAKLEASELYLKKSELEKQELERTLLEGTKRVGMAIDNERTLREQVQSYADKYTSLRDALSSSNEAFDRFKKEIDRVNNKLAKVELEATKWKTKFDEANKNVLVLTLAKKDLEDAAMVADKKMKLLEGLCRELTARKDAASARTDDAAEVKKEEEEEEQKKE